MENRINQIVELADGNKYIVMKQAVYRNENYYVVAKVTDDETDVLEEFDVLKQVIYNDQPCMIKVTDPSLIKLVSQYVGLVEENQE